MEDSWIKQYWRPAIAWQYFAVCVFDFIVFPTFAFALGYFKGVPVTWEPLTLKESGFYHLAMAAIIGVAAWTRGQEKIKRIILGEETIEERSSITQTPTGTDK
jgi:hypothetical protein